MDYAAHYSRLIARARGRLLDGYKERHHVVPKCMGGDNDKNNIVELTGEEHYVAHQLLVKMYPESHGLSVAAVRMARQCTGNKVYGWLKRRYAIAASIAYRGKKRPPRTAEHKARLSRALKGNHNSLGTRRPPISAAQSEKLSIMRRGKKRDPAAVAKTAAWLRGKKHSDERRAKARITAKKRGISSVVRQKMQEALAARTDEQRQASHQKSWATRRANIALRGGA